jgi:hypothetical protein
MPISPEVRAQVEEQFKSRAKEQGWKPGSAKYRNAEMEFFVGAMALQAALSGSIQDVDPKWAIMLMSGRSITVGK